MTRSEILEIAKPILFDGDMIRAILDGRKTVTRRVMKPQPLFQTARKYIFADDVCPKKWEDCDDFIGTYKYQPGDYLYVRETWAKQQGLYWHKAGLKLDDAGRAYGCVPPEKWHPSIHMPKEAARIFLQVTDVRVERLREISINEIAREGIQAEYMFPVFHGIWDSTIKPKGRDKYSWDANPWVWVIGFKKVEVQQ